MKVCITGAGGQLGQALQATAPGHWSIEAIDVGELDLTDGSAVRAHFIQSRPDLVVNAAAYTAVDKAEEDETTARAINQEAVAQMVSALAGTGGKLVHVSTDFVFDGRSARAYGPDDDRYPLSAYGRTKAAGEDALRPADLLVRTAWVYTAGHANFVRTMLRLMRERESLGVVVDQIGAPTWAVGLARVVWGLAEQNAAGTFHHCDAGVASWYDFAVAIQEEAIALGLLDRAISIEPITTDQYPTPARRPSFSLLDCTRTRAALGDATVHWRVNLRRMLEEEQALG